MLIHLLFILAHRAAPLLAALSLVFPATAAGGDIPRPTQAADLTLAQAMALTLERNRELASFEKEIAALGGATLQAGLWRNPELAIDVEDIGASAAQGLQRFTTIRLGQLIELGGKRTARVSAASLAQEIARHEYEAKRVEILARVADAFIEVLGAQERLDLTEQNLRLAQNALGAAAKRVRAGKAAPVEETKSGVAQASARIELEQTRRELTATRKKLSLLWGDPAAQFGQARGSLATTVRLPELATLIERVRNSPAALSGATRVEQRKALLGLEQARRVPDITVNAGVRRYSESRDHTMLVGIAIPLPLFDRNQGNLREAHARLNKAEDEHTATSLSLQSELAQTYEAVAAAEHQIGVLRDEILPAARTAFDLANRGYELGRFSFLEMLDAQRTLFQNQALYLQALVSYQKLVNELERLIAAPLDSAPRTRHE